MKDWQVSGSYFLPRILYFRTRSNTLPGKIPKPNLRFFSLGEDNQWTAWKSSDYFYPEMIPEPDYSDSAEDSEDEDGKTIQPSNSRSTIQRLRDFTEIYMAKVEPKKKTTQSKKAATISAAKAGPKKVKAVSKDSSGKGKSPTKKSPKASPTAPRKVRSKSPTGASVQKAKSPKAVKKSPSKAKSASPTRQKKVPTESKAKPSDEKQTIKKSPPAVSKKQASKSKIKSETLPKRTDKTQVVFKETGETKPVPTSVKKGSGDASKKDSSVTPQTSPSSAKSRSATSGISTEHSSDEEQFIKPKKPYQPSTEKLKLHKELKFTQKYGKLSSSKTELQLALERYTDNKVKRELDAAEKTSLEKILELQAKKVEMQEAMAKTPSWVDRLQRAPATLPNPKTEEFYRVHARVVSNNILAHCFEPDSIECDSLPPKSLCNSENASDS